MSEKINTTKQKIFDTAIKLIKSKGFDLVTLNEICLESNISKNTFYYYFDSKEDVLTSFFTINRQISAENLNEIILSDNNFEMFWKIIEPMLDFFEQMGIQILRQIFVLNLTREIGTFKNDSSKKDHDQHKLEISIIKKAQRNKEIRNTSPPEVLLKTAYMLCIGTAFNWCVHDGCFDLKNSCRLSICTLFDVV